ncbi:hypothetical protein HQ865_24160 [Mucilaginibacter mali]|uniref:Adhesin domain-containing protein n=1 Tax=Mucilaginibacter mali TaxID=2740462 RepID=A0A7D4UM90_9SPHI|nr:hypothetical protein [Mucilaginibacter mali]QKJ32722.1 hypothetical protein HQ865_24160 [Mucilaginibacter mali]
MKSKVYNIAAIAFAGLMAISAPNYAQQSSGTGSSSNSPAPTASAGQNPATTVYSLATPSAIYSTNGSIAHIAPLSAYTFNDLGMLQDSTYRKKMQKLQEQMSALQKEMSSLRGEEMKKAMAERSKLFAENFKKMDLKFDEKFKTLGKLHLNFERSDADFEKKVQSGEYKMKTKAYTKSYNVDANDKLQVENRYGKVVVNTWNKNEVKVDVEIKAYANEDDEAQKLLDLVKINDSKDANGVNFKTQIGDENTKNTWWGTMTTNGKTTVRKTVVNYTVYMPAKNALTIANSYGAIVLPELSGKLDIKNSFGSLTTKALTNPANVINIRYGDANIESLTSADVKLAYGSLDLQSADKLNAEFSYSPAKIGTISTSGNITVRSGDGVQITNLGKNLKTLQVNAQYAPVKLSSLTNDNADFDVTVRYGAFTYNNGVNVTSKSPGEDDRRWTTTQTYKGHIGKGNSDKVIVIKSNYSSVKFDQ